MAELENEDIDKIDKVADKKVNDANWWLGDGSSNFSNWKEGDKPKEEAKKEEKPKEEKKDEKPAEKPKEDEKPKT